MASKVISLLAQSRAVYLGSERILDPDTGLPTDRCELLFLADEYLFDLDLIIVADQVASRATGKEIKPNLKFRIPLKALPSFELQERSLYTVSYGYQAETFSSSEGRTLAYARRFLRAVEPAVSDLTAYYGENAA